MPVYPEQGDSVSSLLAYKLLHLQRQAIKGKGSFDFVVASISLSEATYQASDVLNAMKEDQVLAFSKLRTATEDGIKATNGWLTRLVLVENKGTKAIIKQINELLALMEPSLHLEGGDKLSPELGFTNTDLAVHKTLQAHAPRILETVSDNWIKFSGREIWQELTLVRERLNRLNHLHLSLPENYEIDGADITALVEKFANSDEAAITNQVLRDLLDQHDPNTTEGRAFRRGLLIASQLALENSQRRKGAASVELLHSDLTASLMPNDPLTM
ncbi:hypothetical protein [Rhizobium sp. MHM7A]|uniref:hypothetical protein n=1 Tax=Rhizobium sp. MHM7A TaxID=2583233 RepID=UPI00110639DE|nr:hypothetical protein [Rhizobium sp. MHM7A]TLX15989.1 hypothetical protein FFR93_01340 [Rhizobium sp. MHM7A]